MITDEAIVISGHDTYPSHLFDFIEKDLNHPDFKVKTVLTKNGVVASLEWALPTAVIAYLLKPFFEAFLQEAGKDFYELAKSRIKRLVAENRKIKGKYITAAQSFKKLSEKYDQSITISLKVRLHSNLVATVLFNESIADEEEDQMLESLFQVLNLLYKECQNEKPDDTSKNYSNNEIYLIANLVTRQWEALTPQQMIEKYRI